MDCTMMTPEMMRCYERPGYRQHLNYNGLSALQYHGLRKQQQRYQREHSNDYLPTDQCLYVTDTQGRVYLICPK